MNFYTYVGNDPVNNNYPNGEFIETLWDVANVAMGVASAASNVATGNFGAAALDVAGVVVDVAAVALPGVPGGAGAVIKASRGAAKANVSRRAKAVCARAHAGRAG